MKPQIKIILMLMMALCKINTASAQSMSNLPELIRASGPPSSPSLERYDQKYKYDTIKTRRPNQNGMDKAADEFNRFLESGKSNDVKYQSKSVKVSSESPGVESEQSAAIDSVPSKQSETVPVETISSQLSYSKTFDWEKTKASRYINSPCYKILGFKPEGGAEQEKRYQECEEGYNGKPNYALIITFVTSIIFLVVFILVIIKNRNNGKTDYDYEYKELGGDRSKISDPPSDHVTVNFSPLLPKLSEAKRLNKAISLQYLTPYTFKQFGEDKIGVEPQSIVIDYGNNKVHVSREIALVIGCDQTLLLNSEEYNADSILIKLSPVEYDFAIAATISLSDKYLEVVDPEFGNYVKFFKGSDTYDIKMF
jgi:hypothetical protein